MSLKIVTIFLLISLTSCQWNMKEVVQYNFTQHQLHEILKCAGALFTNNTIITPASCLDDIPENEFAIRETLTYPELGGNFVIIRSLQKGSYRQHVHYDRSDTSRNNIAIITMS